MTRATLLSEIARLAPSLGWTATDLGLLRGKWGQRCTDAQLAACLSRLEAEWDAVADAADIAPEFDPPASPYRVQPLDAWLLSWMPLANFPSTPTPVTAAEERVLRNAARLGLLRDKSKLDNVAAYRQWAERQARLELAEHGRVA